MTLDELRARIVKLIQDMAAANDGKPPSRAAFTKASGIGIAKWKGVLWRSWGDALIEAGFKPDMRRQSDAELLEDYGRFAIQLGRTPTAPDLRLRGKEGKKIANWSTLCRRFGGRVGINARLLQHWDGRVEVKALRAMCGNERKHRKDRGLAGATARGGKSGNEPLLPGFVYLMESGGIYKIGRAVNVEKRWREVATMTPHNLVILHKIKTDDTAGIEAYWHKRFEAKWVKAEWYNLNDEDVKAMKARVMM